MEFSFRKRAWIICVWCKIEAYFQMWKGVLAFYVSGHMNTIYFLRIMLNNILQVTQETHAIIGVYYIT